VRQLPKNLPGRAEEAAPANYDLYTASGEKLVVTHSSYVDSIGESVVTDIDCRILSPVQLLLTGHRFEGWDRSIRITSKTGVTCMGRLTNDNEFVVSKSEVEKLLGKTRRENVSTLAVMAQSSDDDEPDTNDMLLTSANIGNTAAADSEDSEEQDIVDDVVRAELIQHANQSYTREQKARAKKVKAFHEYAHMSYSTLKRALDTGVIAGTVPGPGRKTYGGGYRWLIVITREGTAVL
jgi:hypothetical protein